MSASSNSRAKARLRSELRAQRNALGSVQRRRSASRISRLLLPHSRLQRSHNIAFFLSNDGEPDLSVLMQACLRAGKAVWLPRLSNSYSMTFHRYRPGTPLALNRYGIGEPAQRSERCPAMQLDLVLMPLVAFDGQGNRLGMGGGFYDRAFRFCQRRQLKPFLMGIAHSFQQVEQLPADPWDIPMGAVATEAGIQYLRDKKTIS